MPIVEIVTNSTAIAATEWSCINNNSTIASCTSTGVIQTFLDVSDMVAADILQVRVYERVRAGDAQRIVYESVLRDAQAEPVFVGPSLILMHGWDFTLKAVAGTVTVNWSIRQIA